MTSKRRRRALTPEEKKSSKHAKRLSEQCGVAYVYSISAVAGLLFRHQTNDDLGIDGIIEDTPPSGRESTRGFVAVQIKGGYNYSAGSTRLPGVEIAALRYWLSLPVPTIYCIVKRGSDEKGRLTDAEAYWFNVSALERSGYLDSRDPHKLSLTRSFSEIQKEPNSPVHYSDGLTQDSVRQWYEWLQKGMLSISDQHLAAITKRVDDLLESGHAARAKRELDVYQVQGEVLPQTKAAFSLRLDLAKSFRRIGDVDALSTVLDHLRQAVERFSEEDSVELRGKLSYEEGWELILRSLDAKDPTQFLSSAIGLFRSTKNPTRGLEEDATLVAIKSALIGESAVVHARHLYCRMVTCKQRDQAHVHGGVSDLLGLLARWEALSLDPEMNPIDYYRRIYNSALAMIRWYLSHADSSAGKSHLKTAREQFEQLRNDMAKPAGHHTLHSIAHFHLVEAWLLVLEQHVAAAETLLRNHRITLLSVLPDKEISTYFSWLIAPTGSLELDPL